MTRRIWDGVAWATVDPAPSMLFPSSMLVDNVSYVAGTAARPAVTATASATPHTFGSWIELEPSLSEDVTAVDLALVTTSAVSGGNSSTIVQIGVGAASSEVVWGEFLGGYSNAIHRWTLPGHIPAGSRVAMRVQSAIASKTIAVVPHFWPAKTGIAFGSPHAMGLDYATSQGVALITATTGVKGPWTEIEDSTPSEMNALLVSGQLAGLTTVGAPAVLIDIGIGADGAETVLIGDIGAVVSTSENITWRSPTTYGVHIPAGSRLSARFQRSSTTTNAIDLALLGA